MHGPRRRIVLFPVSDPTGSVCRRSVCPRSKYPGIQDTGTHRCYGINDVAVIGSGIDCHTYKSEVNTLRYRSVEPFSSPLFKNHLPIWHVALKAQENQEAAFDLAFAELLFLAFAVATLGTALLAIAEAALSTSSKSLSSCTYLVTYGM